jgi:nicotinate-nucleotide adenylyltransferase
VGAPRVGIFGGTFDPPHIGHLLVAMDATDALQLDRLLWIPAATQPFKVGATEASAEHRVAMVERTIEGERRFAVEPMEVNRKGLSFTVETLEALAIREPSVKWVLLLGADAANQFAAWRDPERIRELAEIAILDRPGSAMLELPGAIRLATRQIDISSTEVRARVRAGRSIKGFVTDAVAAYIAESGLYR